MDCINKTINVFCFIGKTESGKSKYINSILNDKLFMEENRLNLMIYGTTRKKRINEMDGIDYYFMSEEQFEQIPSNELIEQRSYYKLDEGIVHYFTTTKQFVSNRNIICTASPYQFESYRNWINKQNIIYPNKYKLFIIYINTPTATRIKRSIDRICPADDIMIYEICRRILEEKNEFDNVSSRIPELKDALLYETNCYINNEKSGFRAIRSNIKKIKKFLSMHCSKE